MRISDWSSDVCSSDLQRYPAALARTLDIADRCRFSLDELKYQYPEEAGIEGITAQQALERMTWQAAEDRYPEGVRSEEHTSELQSLMRISYAVLCVKKNKKHNATLDNTTHNSII